MSFPPEKINVICCLCNNSVESYWFLSLSCFGPSDLDTRPAEYERSAIYSQIQHCQKCGYCSTNIAEVPDSKEQTEILELLVESAQYKEILNNSSVHEKSSEYLAQAYLFEMRQEYIAAFWSTVKAAWICDDQGDSHNAKENRIRALYLFDLASNSSKAIPDNSFEYQLIRIDLMRRVSLFPQMKELALKAFIPELDENDRMILEFQISLSNGGDKDGHSLEEIFPRGSVPEKMTGMLVSFFNAIRSPHGWDLLAILKEEDFFIFRLLCVHYPFSEEDLIKYKDVLIWGSSMGTKFDCDGYCQTGLYAEYGLSYNANIPFSTKVRDIVNQYSSNHYQATWGEEWGEDLEKPPLSKEVELESMLRVLDYVCFENREDPIGGEELKEINDYLILVDGALTEEFSLLSFSEFKSGISKLPSIFCLNESLYENLISILVDNRIDIYANILYLFLNEKKCLPPLDDD